GGWDVSSGSRLLPEERSKIGGVAQARCRACTEKVRTAWRPHSKSRSGSQDRNGHRDKSGQGGVRSRKPPRSQQGLSQDERKRFGSTKPRFWLGCLSARHRRPCDSGSERHRAGIFQADGCGGEDGFAGRLENLSAMARSSLQRTHACSEIREREFQILFHDISRQQGAESAL